MKMEHEPGLNKMELGAEVDAKTYAKAHSSLSLKFRLGFAHHQKLGDNKQFGVDK